MDEVKSNAQFHEFAEQLGLLLATPHARNFSHLGYYR